MAAAVLPVTVFSGRGDTRFAWRTRKFMMTTNVAGQRCSWCAAVDAWLSFEHLGSVLARRYGCLTQTACDGRRSGDVLRAHRTGCHAGCIECAVRALTVYVGREFDVRTALTAYSRPPVHTRRRLPPAACRQPPIQPHQQATSICPHRGTAHDRFQRQAKEGNGLWLCSGHDGYPSAPAMARHQRCLERHQHRIRVTDPLGGRAFRRRVSTT